MITLNEEIFVEKNIDEVFSYTSDFSNIENWDPSVISSVKLGDGEVKTGTEFDLTLKFAGMKSEMRYIITELEPNRKVVLKGEGKSYKALDTITFKEEKNGTIINYKADIEFSGKSQYMEFLLSPILKIYGKKSMEGLYENITNKKFEGVNSIFKSGSGYTDFILDRTIVPGALGFTKLGYSLGKTFWEEGKKSLLDKHVVITGGTSGIGKAATFKLAENKAKLTIIARDEEKTLKLIEELKETTENKDIDYIIGDLSIMEEVKKVSDKLKTKKKIDVLINNAGALFEERKRTPEGFERTFAIDLLGIYFLTQNLIDADRINENGRIINVSSGGMYTRKIDVNDLQNEKKYSGPKAYANAKRGVVILTEIWAEKLKSKNISVHAMHPGWVATPGLETSLPKFYSYTKPLLREPHQGADTIVWLTHAEKPAKNSGLFWFDRRPHETHVFPWTKESQAEKDALVKKLDQHLERFRI